MSRPRAANPAASPTCEELEALVLQGLAVVEDFLPNIGHCVLQDYGRLNEFCMAAGRLKNRRLRAGEPA